MSINKLNASSYAAVFLVSSFLFLGLTAQAQEIASSTKVASSSAPEQITASTSVPVQTNNQSKINELRSERQTALKEFRQQRVLNLSANISNRMDAANNRLANIITRLEQRIAKLQQAGYATELASAELNNAKENLFIVQNLLNGIDTIIYNATTSDQPYNNWKQVKERYLEIGIRLRSVQQNLRDIIGLLKSVSPEAVSLPATTTEKIISIEN